jgi:hypothetical protein
MVILLAILSAKQKKIKVITTVKLIEYSSEKVTKKKYIGIYSINYFNPPLYIELVMPQQESLFVY